MCNSIYFTRTPEPYSGPVYSIKTTTPYTPLKKPPPLRSSHPLSLIKPVIINLLNLTCYNPIKKSSRHTLKKMISIQEHSNRQIRQNYCQNYLKKSFRVLNMLVERFSEYGNLNFKACYAILKKHDDRELFGKVLLNSNEIQ